MNGLMFVLAMTAAAVIVFSLLRLRSIPEPEPEPAVERPAPTMSPIAEDFDAMGAAMDRIWPFQGGNDPHDQDRQ